jgi:hypothetical protein
MRGRSACEWAVSRHLSTSSYTDKQHLQRGTDDNALWFGRSQQDVFEIGLAALSLMDMTWTVTRKLKGVGEGRWVQAQKFLPRLNYLHFRGSFSEK